MRTPVRGFEWDDLRVFLAVFRAGTVSGAAQKLGVDHTTISRRIARLEKSLKAQLFQKKVTGYEPSPAGERLLATAEAMEAAILSAQSDIGGRDVSLSGIVRIGAPDGFGSVYLAPRLRKLCQQMRQLEIELVATARNFNLTKREAEIAFSLTMPQHGRIATRRLTDYKLGLYATETYLRGASKIRSVSDLPEHDFIGYIDDLLFTSELNYIPSIGRGIKPRFRSGNLIAQLHACLAGGGIAVIPNFMAVQYPALRPVLPKDVRLFRTFYLQVHEDCRHLARVRETVEFIVEQVHRDRDLFSPQEP